VLQGLLGCALMGQFVIVVLGVASVLSPVIVLRLAVLVLGFQVLCLPPRHSRGHVSRRQGRHIAKLAADRDVEPGARSPGWVVNIDLGSCWCPGAGGSAALAPWAAAPVVLPAARHRNACGSCGLPAAIVQRARRLVLPMLLPVAPQVVSSSSCKQLAEPANCNHLQQTI
jgi:hypothetical protein